MLQIKDESVPSTGTIWVSRNSHESIGHGVKVLNETLEPSDAALKEASDKDNDSIVAILLFSSID